MLTPPQYSEENDEHLVLFEKFCFIVVYPRFDQIRLGVVVVVPPPGR
jgi:hypothetical protein